jgi:hypothetical protein
VNAPDVGGVAATDANAPAPEAPAPEAPAAEVPAATEGTASAPAASDPTDAVITQARDDIAAIRDKVKAEAHANRNAATVLNALDGALVLINEAVNTPA